MHRITLAASLLMLLSAPAVHAVTIGNCGDETHSVLGNVGGHIEQYMLEPGQVHKVLSPTVRLQIGEQPPVTARYYEHYCIWDGKLLIQRKSLRNRHH